MRQIALVCSAFGVFSAVLFGQQGRPQSQSPLTFRSGVDAVTVDAFVSDKQGRPVLDLAAADFEIREAGKVQKIDTFRLVRTAGAADPDPMTIREITSEADQERETARDDVRLIVIMLDDYHVGRVNSIAVRDKIAAFVRKIPRTDLVALMYPMTPLTSLVFSRDREEQARQIEKFVGREYDYFPRNAAEELYSHCSPAAIEDIRANVTTDTLKVISTYLGSLRERRATVLFVSEGLGGRLPKWVTENQGSGACTIGAPWAPVPLLHGDGRSLIASAIEGNTAIYTLDPRGPDFDDLDMRDRTPEDAAAGRERAKVTQEFLRNLSYETGGRAIVSTNSFDQLLPQMLRDTEAYYLMGYTSTLAKHDGQFHEIDVRVKRPGVDIRARKGYWAFSADDLAKATAPPKAGPSLAIVNALTTLTSAPGGHVIRTWAGAAKGAGSRSAVTVAWEALGVATSMSPPTAARATVIAVSASDGARLFDGVIESGSGSGPAGGHVTFAAPPGALRLTTIARAADGHTLDVEEREMTVPDFTGTGTSLSTPLVFQGRTARDIQQVRAATDPQPTITRDFSRQDRLLVRFRAYGPGGLQPVVSLRFLTMEGELLAGLPGPTTMADGSLEAEISLAPLATGTYLIEITGTADTGQAQALIAFHISG